MSSRLDFKDARILALTCIAKGEKVLWELDFGFFDRLSYPFGHETEAQSMMLAVDHFIKTLWPEFKSYTQGVIFYRGSLDFDPVLFSDYLKFLTINVFDEIPLQLRFKKGTESPLDLARKISPDLYPRFEVFVDDLEPPFRSMESKIGFLLPSSQDKVFEDLVQNGVDLRVISEPTLTSEWDGLDYLIIDADKMDKEGIRKLRGFAAAGGIVVTLGERIGITDELLFDREFFIPHP